MGESCLLSTGLCIYTCTHIHTHLQNKDSVGLPHSGLKSLLLTFQRSLPWPQRSAIHNRISPLAILTINLLTTVLDQPLTET